MKEANRRDLAKEVDDALMTLMQAAVVLGSLGYGLLLATPTLGATRSSRLVRGERERQIERAAEVPPPVAAHPTSGE